MIFYFYKLTIPFNKFLQITDVYSSDNYLTYLILFNKFPPVNKLVIR